MIRASAPYTSGWGSFVLLKMDCIRVARGGSLSMLHRYFILQKHKLQNTHQLPTTRYLELQCESMFKVMRHKLKETMRNRRVCLFHKKVTNVYYRYSELNWHMLFMGSLNFCSCTYIRIKKS